MQEGQAINNLEEANSVVKLCVDIIKILNSY